MDSNELFSTPGVSLKQWMFRFHLPSDFQEIYIRKQEEENREF